MLRCQRRILIGLVHQAQSTRFGRDHDFRRIRTAADFRRLVPLRSLSDFCREYWQVSGCTTANATWPGPVLWHAPSTCVANGAMHNVPVTHALLAAHRSAAMAALALVCRARPRARLFSGRVALLASDDGSSWGNSAATCSIESIACRQLPSILKPYALALSPKAFGRAGSRDRRLVPGITCLLGSARQLADLFTNSQEQSSRGQMPWPRLTAAIYTCDVSSRDRRRLHDTVADRRDFLLLEACYRPEGAIAIEDPHRGSLRLLADHGVFFEFIPRAELGKREPTRHSLGEIEPGEAYAVAISSPAGAWACLGGEQVVFESRDPPLLRRLTQVAFTPPPAFAAPPFAVQPPHYLRDLASKSKRAALHQPAPK